MLRTPVVELPPEAPSGEDPDAISSSPRPARAPGQAIAAHARARRLRRLAGLAVLITPTFWVVSTDFLRRGRLLLAFDRPHALGYLGSVVESLLFWGVLLHVAARR